MAEIVREKVLRHTRDELPFSSAVIVDQFEEADDRGLMRLYCTILVERESQKPIVIGRGGSMIKQIGTEARQELETSSTPGCSWTSGSRRGPDWRDDPRSLDEIGIRED